jgi:hypothetical protein
MGLGKTTRITIDTDRVLIVAHHKEIRVWCQQCGEAVEVVTSGGPGTLVAHRAKVVEIVRQEPNRSWRALIGGSVRRFLKEGLVG